MGHITLHLDYEPATGRKEIRVEYESEADRTRVEHEAEHRHIVETLAGKGLVSAENAGRVVEIPRNSADRLFVAMNPRGLE